MATKEELVNAINEILGEGAEQLTKDSGTHDELTAILAELTNEDEGEDNSAASGHVIEKGKAITSKRGILGEGDEVTADDFTGGADTFKNLVAKGFISES